MPRAIPVSIPGYHLERSVGEGNAGTVYLGRRNSSDTSQLNGLEVAVKVIPRSKVREAVRREVALHITLFHPNIARLHRVVPARPASTSRRSSHCSSPTCPSPTSLALVMDYGSVGDMFTEVASAGSLPGRVIRRRLKDIASGLQYLHQNGIAHLDVKLENVVINSCSTAKLIDFGCARYVKDCTESSKYSSFGGTLHYLAPEVVETSSPVPSTSSDTWALGVLAYTAMVGSYPFAAPSADPQAMEDEDAVRHRIVNCAPHRIPSSIRMASDVQKMIYGLLEKDPKKRMSISQVLSELERCNESTRYRVARVGSTDRPRSPAGPTEADFSGYPYDTKQTGEEALEIVDSIQSNRGRSDWEVAKANKS